MGNGDPKLVTGSNETETALAKEELADLVKTTMLDQSIQHKV